MSFRRCLVVHAVSTSVLLAPGAANADKAECLQAYESAQRQRKAGALGKAREAAVVCAATECPTLIKSDCTTWVAELERAIPTVVVVAKSDGREVSDVRVSVDGRRLADALTGKALAVDPGERHFVFERQGARVDRTINVREGEKLRRVTLSFDPPAPAEKPAAAAPSPTTYALASVGVLGLGGFIFFGAKGLSGRSDLEDCKGRCRQSDVDDVKADFTRADVSLAVSLVAFGAATYLYFSSAPGTPQVGVKPLRSGAAGSVALSF